jgi:hypothetical protein
MVLLLLLLMIIMVTIMMMMMMMMISMVGLAAIAGGGWLTGHHSQHCRLSVRSSLGGRGVQGSSSSSSRPVVRLSSVDWHHSEQVGIQRAAAAAAAAGVCHRFHVAIIIIAVITTSGREVHGL